MEIVVRYICVLCDLHLNCHIKSQHSCDKAFNAAILVIIICHHEVPVVHYPLYMCHHQQYHEERLTIPCPICNQNVVSDGLALSIMGGQTEPSGHDQCTGVCCSHCKE